MSKTDTCTKCGQVGHTASSCKRVQCVRCENFRMTLRKVLYTCTKDRAWWSPGPVFWRECGKFTQADAATVARRLDALGVNP